MLFRIHAFSNEASKQPKKGVRDILAFSMTDKLISVITSFALAMSLCILSPAVSYADPATSQAVLDDAQAKLDQITGEYNALSTEISALQTQIDELATQVLDAQQAMLDGRAALGATVTSEYRGGSIPAILSVILGSSDLTELTRNINYVNQIMQQQAEGIQTQRELKDRFNAVSDKLTVQKDEQTRKLDELATKREQAAAVVEEASAQVEADNARIAQMRKQADQFIWGGVKEEQTANSTDESVQTTNPQDDESTATVPAQNNQASTNPAPSDTSNMRTVVSSAYGGSTDPNTPNPGITANGSVCNDNTMGIAIPKSWSNRTSYYGKKVEITWNGRTVYATINDCGNMDKYGCEIDLQPGVWKALDPSCTSCNQWGHRTVKYRVL